MSAPPGIRFTSSIAAVTAYRGLAGQVPRIARGQRWQRRRGLGGTAVGPWGWGLVALALIVLGGVSIFALPPLLLIGLGALLYTVILTLRGSSRG